MNPDSLLGFLYIYISVLGVAWVWLQSHWARQDKKAERDQRKREYLRRLNARQN